MAYAVAVVVESQVQPLLVLPQEAVGVVDAALRAVAAFFVENTLVGPGLQADEAYRQGEWAAVL
jgi:hypothetical protein